MSQAPVSIPVGRRFAPRPTLPHDVGDQIVAPTMGPYRRAIPEERSTGRSPACRPRPTLSPGVQYFDASSTPGAAARVGRAFELLFDRAAQSYLGAANPPLSGRLDSGQH